MLKSTNYKVLFKIVIATDPCVKLSSAGLLSEPSALMVLHGLITQAITNFKISDVLQLYHALTDFILIYRNKF